MASDLTAALVHSAAGSGTPSRIAMPNQELLRLQGIFAAAADLPPASSQQELARACADNPTLLAYLRELIESAGRLQETPAQPDAAGLIELPDATAPEASLAGRRVGAFELREELGRGGMGVVYRAERVDGSVSQQVAIKFVRRELLGYETRRRFMIERRMLAAMDHPNIARLIDAAELPDGTPYFVMEYVDGISIDQYCDAAKLDVRARVEIFRTVCNAVMQAHRSLVIHRDLKPGNILVSKTGLPKLLDFGIAKPLLDMDLAKQPQTGTQQRYFSPQYAAPEQLLGQPVGVGCDVYALGLLLFELLVGSRPFDFTGLSTGQIEQLISSMPAPAPSSTAARVGKSTAIQHQLRGDLDGIVLQCLRKAPIERYASVEQLDADLANYLEGRPVVARGGHRWYRLRKFVGRNASAVTTGILLGGALAAAAAALVWQAGVALDQARIAKQRAEDLQLVSNFQAEMLSEVDPTQAGLLLRRDLATQFTDALARSGLAETERAQRSAVFAEQLQSVNATDTARAFVERTMLLPAATAIDRKFSGQPVVDAALRQVLADRYRQWGLLSAARPLQERALALRREALGLEHEDTLRSTESMGKLLLDLGLFDEAAPYAREVLDRRLERLGESHPDTLKSMHQLGSVYLRQGRLAEAEVIVRQAMDGQLLVLGSQHADTLATIDTLGSLAMAAGRDQEAEARYRTAYEGRRRVLGDNHQLTLSTLSNVVVALTKQGEYAKSEPLVRLIYTQSREVLGETHPDTITAINNLGAVLEFQGKYAEGLVYRREALALAQRILGNAHPDTLTFRDGVGSALMSMGEYLEAEKEWREVLETRRSVLGAEHPETLSALVNLALVIRAQSRNSEAEPLLREAFETRFRVLGAEHRDTLLAMINLGSLQVILGHHADAVALLRPGEAIFRKTFADANARFSWKYAIILGRALLGAGELKAAESKLLDVEVLVDVAEYPEVKDKRDCHAALVEVYRKLDIIEPGKGHEARVAAWQLELDADLLELYEQSVKAK